MQVLSLLTLAPEVVKVIDRLGGPLPAPIVTERFLRSILGLNEFERMKRLDRRLMERILENTRKPQTPEQSLPE